MFVNTQFHKKKIRKVVRACSMINPHEGYRSATPLDAARYFCFILRSKKMENVSCEYDRLKLRDTSDTFVGRAFSTFHL